MIQKIFITILVITIALFGVRFLKKITGKKNSNNKKNDNTDNVVDLEKDPETNEYKPKE